MALYFRTEFNLAEPAKIKTLNKELIVDDGAVIYLHVDGRCDLRGRFGAGALLIGGAHFETADSRYRWLNTVHAVYRGIVVGDGLAGDAVYHDEYFEVR